MNLQCSLNIYRHQVLEDRTCSCDWHSRTNWFATLHSELVLIYSCASHSVTHISHSTTIWFATLDSELVLIYRCASHSVTHTILLVCWLIRTFYPFLTTIPHELENNRADFIYCYGQGSREKHHYLWSKCVMILISFTGCCGTPIGLCP